LGFINSFFKHKNGIANLFHTLIVKIAELAIISFFAQLFLYPLLAVYFHKISIVSIISNLVLVPASGLAMTIGFAMAIWPPSWPLWTLLIKAAYAFMAFFIGAVKFFAGLPFSAFFIPSPDAVVIAGYFIAAFALIHAPLLRRRSIYAAFFGFLLIAAAYIWPHDKNEISLFTDGQVFSALIRCKDGKLIIVNPSLNSKSVSESVLFAGKFSVDFVLLTDLNENKIRALAKLSDRINIKNIILPPGSRPEIILPSLTIKSALNTKSIWPGENILPAITLDWGDIKGYSGHDDSYDWHICKARVYDRGRCAHIGENVLCAQSGDVKTLLY